MTDTISKEMQNAYWDEWQQTQDHWLALAAAIDVQHGGSPVLAPLVWIPTQSGWQAQTPFGNYTVLRRASDWVWGYCFDEYYDEDMFGCESADEGKRLAWENWVSRASCIVVAHDKEAA